MNLAELHRLDRPRKTVLERRGWPQLPVSAPGSGAIEWEYVSSQHLATGTLLHRIRRFSGRGSYWQVPAS